MSWRPMIYVAGKYSADTREAVNANVALAEEHGQLILQAGYIPVIPHKITSNWDLIAGFKAWTHSDWIKRFCFPLLTRCDAVYFVPGWENSEGAKMEFAKAMEWRLPIVFCIEELQRMV